MNLAGFKKLKEDKKTVTMGHPQGHSITILKSKLSALQRKQIEKLELNMADGGDVEETGSSDSAPEAPAAAQKNTGNPFLPSLSQIGDLGKGAAHALGVIGLGGNPLSDKPFDSTPAPAPDQMQKVGEFNYDQAPAQPSPDQTQAKAPDTGNDSGVDVNKAYQQGQRAITEQQNVASRLAKNVADVQQKDIEARKQLQTDFQDNTKAFMDHQKQFMNDYLNNHIDPKHYQENMSTGQKVSTAIGLLLGGFSKNGVNPAQEWLNAQINRDIEAQKSRIDQQKTILGANQELYHDNVLANNAARISMNEIYDHQIQQEANKDGTASAKANADAQHSKFAMENNSLLQQSALRGAALKQIKQSGGAGLDPITLGQAGFMSPEEAKKEQEAFTAHRDSISDVNNLYTQARKEQTFLNLFNPQSYSRINEINAGLTDALLRSDITHRYNPETAKDLLKPYFLNTRDDATTMDFKQTGALQKISSTAAAGMPITSRYAPASVPRFEMSQRPQFQPGQIVYKNGQKGEVLANGQIRAVK